MQKKAYAAWIAITALFLMMAPVQAGETVTLDDGRKMELKDDGTYRFLSGKADTSVGGFSEIKLADLKVDIKEMSGKRVRVEGKGTYFGQTLMLGDPDQPFDTSPLFVGIDSLPRDARKWIVTHCGQSCTLIVEGEIKDDMVLFTPGINAINIVHR